MKTITTAEFDKEVLQSTLPVLVKFTADYCVPCKKLQPILEDLAKEVEGKAIIVKVDTEDSSELASKYKIRGIPAMLLFVNGEVVKTQVGSAPKEKLLSMFSFDTEEE